VRQLRLRDIGGIVVIDFIDMVLESNRDLVLRRLTEALARDRTRHQVSEVTSLGLVQLTRKRLGTGLIEAFSTQCPHCGGRGILLHGDPVDAASTAARKSESGGRRAKRGKRGGKSEDLAVAKVPVHHAGEHPMFKAMAAANGRHEADEGDGEVEETKVAEEVAELDPETIRAAVEETAEEELEDDDFDESDDDESDDDESDEDEMDLDADDEDDDIDDDIEVIDDDSDDDDSDDDDEDEDDSDEDDDYEEPGESVPVSPPAGRHRRRAAARPAGPPIHGS
jgi:ribonuclease E